MKRVLSLLLCFFIHQTASATAFFRDSSDLEQLDDALAPLSSGDKSTFAKGYVAGVADATSGTLWCPLPQMKERQIYLSVAKFMRIHPESSRRGASEIVTQALAADFPCDKK